MLKRFLAASVIFFILLGLVMLPNLLGIYRGISRGATGIAFVLGSPAEKVFRVGVLLVLVMSAFWLSGKLIGR